MIATVRVTDLGRGSTSSRVTPPPPSSCTQGGTYPAQQSVQAELFPSLNLTFPAALSEAGPVCVTSVTPTVCTAECWAS